MKKRLTTIVFRALVALSLMPVAVAAPAAAAESVSLTCFPHGSGPVDYVDSWGAPRSGGRGHTGTDLMSPRGLEVVAAADGYVETLRNGSRSGFYIRLSHDGGAWETWYMHLNNDTPGTDDGRGGAEAAYAPGIEVGDFVEAGEVIAYVGDSGNAEWTAPHTHFELHIGGKKVNPYGYLVEAESKLIEAREMLDAALTAPSVGPEQADLPELWASLAEAGTDRCLSDGYQNAVEHFFGQLPSERVVLARVIAR